MKLATADNADARSAMHELTGRYWFPVYAYLRHSGHAPNVAEGIARAFLHALLRHFREQRVPPQRSRFRRYLLDQLHAFLNSDWRDIVESDGDELAVPPGLELRYRNDSAAASSPEQAYHAGFAREIIARAYRCLQGEATRAGHQDLFVALEAYLEREPAPGDYAALSQRLAMRPLALVVALKRLRERFRDLVSEELADTVTSADELAAEQAALLAILHGGQELR